MRIEKDGVVKELSDSFMLADYLQAGWKEFKTPQFKEIKERPFKKLKVEKDDK